MMYIGVQEWLLERNGLLFRSRRIKNVRLCEHREPSRPHGSELMRRSVEGITLSGIEEGTDALILRVNASSQEADDALDDALSVVKESHKRIAAMRGGR
jgi:hypothetical protein